MCCRTRREFVDVGERAHAQYHPAVDDVCVGVVRSKGKDKYFVDIGAYRDAELDNLAFENATKRSRPLLEDGDAVYCRVGELAERPHVVCVSKRNMEDGYGPLVGGWVFDVPQLTARRLMADGCSVLATIGQYTPFEVAVGVNGRVWVRSPNPGRDVVVEHCVVACIGVADANVAGTVKLVWESWQKVVD